MNNFFKEYKTGVYNTSPFKLSASWSITYDKVISVVGDGCAHTERLSTGQLQIHRALCLVPGHQSSVLTPPGSVSPVTEGPPAVDFLCLDCLLEQLESLPTYIPETKEKIDISVEVDIKF